MVRILPSALLLLVITFPITSGSVLTFLGITKFSEATIPIIPKEPSPYGILTFSSVYCELKGLGLNLYYLDLKNNMAAVHVMFEFYQTNASSQKQTFGIQVPGIAQLEGTVLGKFVPSGLSLRGFNYSEGKPTGASFEINITNFDAIITGMEMKEGRLEEANNTSIIFFEFDALEELMYYEVDFWFVWRDFMIKKTFSTYDILVPFSMNDHGNYNVVHRYFPETYLTYGKSFDHNANLGLFMTSGTQILESVPPPSEEVLFPEGRAIGWEDFLVGINPIDRPNSRLIRVSIQDTEVSDVHDRLLFDSGLYLGIGLSLIFSGLYEALKVVMELRRKQIK